MHAIHSIKTYHEEFLIINWTRAFKSENFAVVRPFDIILKKITFKNYYSSSFCECWKVIIDTVRSLKQNNVQFKVE